MRPWTRVAPLSSSSSPGTTSCWSSAGPEEPETGLRRALREGEWVVSVELDPPKGGSSTGLVEVARALRGSGVVGLVDVNDNPMARARMNALMASVRIEREAGIETIPHVTPRDASVMGLEGLLLGAHAEGVRNVLAVTGDPPHVGDYPGSRGVYEVDSIGSASLLSGLNRGEDYVGKGLMRPTFFYVGVAVNPTADDLELELERFRRKLNAGAHFAMTQALFDLEPLDRFVERLGGEWPIRCSSASGRCEASRWAFAFTTRCRGSACRTGCSARSRTPARTRRASGSSSRGCWSRAPGRAPTAST